MLLYQNLDKTPQEPVSCAAAIVVSHLDRRHLNSRSMGRTIHIRNDKLYVRRKTFCYLTSR